MSNRRVGEESSKTYQEKHSNNFFNKYMGGCGLDVGYKGYLKDVVPILPGATGVDLDYPGYDGRTLPFINESQDYVYSSHVLEHVSDYVGFIRDLYRVVKFDGHLILTVPHKYLYEKKRQPPSRYNADHKRFYTPSSLLSEVEEALTPNSYRVEICRDVADGFDYSIPAEKHSGGCYEIELVLKKIRGNSYGL